MYQWGKRLSPPMDTAGVTSALNALESFKVVLVWEYRRFISVQVQFIPKYSVSKYNLCIICMYFVVYKKVNSSLVTTVQILPTLGSDRGLCNTSEIIIIILVMVIKKCFFYYSIGNPRLPWMWIAYALYRGSRG